MLALQSPVGSVCDCDWSQPYFEEDEQEDEEDEWEDEEDEKEDEYEVAEVVVPSHEYLLLLLLLALDPNPYVGRAEKDVGKVGAVASSRLVGLGSFDFTSGSRRSTCWSPVWLAIKGNTK